VSRELVGIELSEPDTVSVTTKQPITEFGLVVSEVDAKNYHVMPKRATTYDPDADRAYDQKPIGLAP
jgi:hypothetical protein